MINRRSWVTRAVLAAVVFACLAVGAAIDGATPRLFPMLLFACAVVALVALVHDTEVFGTVSWEADLSPAHSVTHTLDGGLFANVRLLENHLNARETDPALQSRLRRLTDTRLAQLGLHRSDPDVAARLGPTVAHVLDGPPRQLSMAEIEECVRRIEELSS
jgi:hypothetical protein